MYLFPAGPLGDPQPLPESLPQKMKKIDGKMDEQRYYSLDWLGLCLWAVCAQEEAEKKKKHFSRQMENE